MKLLSPSLLQQRHCLAIAECCPREEQARSCNAAGSTAGTSQDRHLSLRVGALALHAALVKGLLAQPVTGPAADLASAAMLGGVLMTKAAHKGLAGTCFVLTQSLSVTLQPAL